MVSSRVVRVFFVVCAVHRTDAVMPSTDGTAAFSDRRSASPCECVHVEWASSSGPNTFRRWSCVLEKGIVQAVYGHTRATVRILGRGRRWAGDDPGSNGGSSLQPFVLRGAYGGRSAILSWVLRDIYKTKKRSLAETKGVSQGWVMACCGCYHKKRTSKQEYDLGKRKRGL